jgi:hypothetical protein
MSKHASSSRVATSGKRERNSVTLSKLCVIKRCERKKYMVDLAIATGILGLTQEPLGNKMIKLTKVMKVQQG